MKKTIITAIIVLLFAFAQTGSVEICSEGLQEGPGYVVVRSNTLDLLVLRVNTMIERGWSPQGGMEVVSYRSPEGMLYFQAMYRQ